jgi:peptidoglycan/LPS O-acetylase OafA/YrhL
MLALFATFFVIQIGFLIFTHALTTPDANSYWISTFGYSGIDLVAACAIVLAIDSSTSAYRILNRRSLRRLGQISYGFYVFHNIPHNLYERMGQQLLGDSLAAQMLGMIIAFLCTLLLATLSFRFFETPFLRLKDRFTIPDKQ